MSFGSETWPRGSSLRRSTERTLSANRLASTRQRPAGRTDQGEQQPCSPPVGGSPESVCWPWPVLRRRSARPHQQPVPQQTTIKIPFETYTLANGLTVILSVDHTTPTVAVNVWYHVGSKNELPGRTGFAHLFEHVMFTGSGHVPYGLHDKLTEGVGGSNNGTTSNDRTTYFETVPSNYLESALWIESDRMGFLLDTLDIAKLNAQRDIVKNERRQGVDNQPYGLASARFSRAATYPESHPYSWDVIGSMADLSAASEEDVKNFFRLYYAPNNAFLAIVGDFDPAQAKAWVAKYFADIPRGKPVTRPDGRVRCGSPASSTWCTRTRCRSRASTSSGRRSARRATTSSRST